MRYENTARAVFLERPNRFVARVELHGRKETVHVKNTGRCRELLVPGAEVILSASDRPGRKTAYDLVAVYKGDTLINMDSQAPNAAAAELLRRLYPRAVLTPERRFASSRFDFYLELGPRRIFTEVKGVTLEREGLALFPDAPTERGRRHLEELCLAAAAGYEAWVLFLIQMKGCRCFSPNRETDPAFARALERADGAGVRLLCYDCAVTPESMTADAPVEIRL